MGAKAVRVFVALLLLSFATFLSDSIARLNAQDVPKQKTESKLPAKCALVGEWGGIITLPDGADGVSVNILFAFLKSGNKIAVKGSAGKKPLVIQNVQASCTDFSFLVIEGADATVFSGSLSADGHSIGGTVKKREFSASWSVQKK